MAARVSLMAMLLSGCTGLAGMAGGASLVSIYSILTTINTVAEVSEETVCGAYGAYYALNRVTPDNLSGVEKQVSTFCSGDPVIGSTPFETLTNLLAHVGKLHAAAAPARSDVNQKGPL